MPMETRSPKTGLDCLAQRTCTAAITPKIRSTDIQEQAAITERREVLPLLSSFCFVQREWR